VSARYEQLLDAIGRGLSFDQVAQLDPVEYPWAAHWGGSTARVAQDARRALERAATHDREIADTYVTLESRRLDGVERRVQQVIARAAQANDNATVLRAVDRLIRLSERRSELRGLNAGSSTRNTGGPVTPTHDDDELGRRRRNRRTNARLAHAQAVAASEDG